MVGEERLVGIVILSCPFSIFSWALKVIINSLPTEPVTTPMGDTVQVPEPLPALTELKTIKPKKKITNNKNIFLFVFFFLIKRA